MPLNKNIFLFAFANDSAKSLRLGDEANLVQDLLKRPHLLNRFEYMPLVHTKLDNIYKTFRQHHNQIVCFHFGGHSNDRFLNLVDGGARTDSFGTLLGIQDELKLVVLNGCDNEGQVEELLKKGVKVIIATKQEISDDRALTFCEHFYGALTGSGENSMSIHQAFIVARSRLMNEKGKPPSPDKGEEISTITEYVSRGQGLLLNQSQGFEWELFVKDKSYGDWTLNELKKLKEPKPEEFSEPAPLPVGGFTEGFKQNELLLSLAFDLDNNRESGILKYSSNSRLVNLIDTFEETSSVPYDDLDPLFEIFPSMISDPLEGLFSRPEGLYDGRLRLQLINEVCLSIGNILANISLSNLWEAIVDPYEQCEGKELFISDELKGDILKYLKEGVPAYEDSFWIAEEISGVFNANQNVAFNMFPPEISGLFGDLNKDLAFYRAYRDLDQTLRNRLKSIPSSEVSSLCVRTEEALGVILQRCSFISQYALVTVRNAFVYQPRHESVPVYTLEHSNLYGKNSHYKGLSRVDPMNTNSLFFVEDLSFKKKWLNLSPFIIDENAFRSNPSDDPKIYFFNGIDQAGNLHYIHSNPGKPEDRDPIVIEKASARVGQGFKYYWKPNSKSKSSDNSGVGQHYKEECLESLFGQISLFREALEK